MEFFIINIEIITVVYRILIAIIFASAVLFTVAYYTTLEHDSMSDWTAEGVGEGCTAGTKNGYGIPSIIICPSDAIHNLTKGISSG